MTTYTVEVIQYFTFPEVEATSKEQAERIVKGIEPNTEEEYIWDETAPKYGYVVKARED